MKAGPAAGERGVEGAQTSNEGTLYQSSLTPHTEDRDPVCTPSGQSCCRSRAGSPR